MSSYQEYIREMGSKTVTGGDDTAEDLERQAILNGKRCRGGSASGTIGSSPFRYSRKGTSASRMLPICVTYPSREEEATTSGTRQ